MRQMSNQSETWGELKDRVPGVFQELLLLVQKAPREKLFELIPPENFEALFAALLEDPIEQEKSLKLYGQRSHASKLQNECPDGRTTPLAQLLNKISAETVKKLDREIKQKQRPLLQSLRKLEKSKDKTAQVQQEIARLRNEMRGIQPSEEDRKRVRAAVEEKFLKPAHRQRINEIQLASERAQDLDNAWQEYRNRIDIKTMKIVDSVLTKGIDYYIEQVPKLVSPNLLEMIKQPLEQAKVPLTRVMREALDVAEKQKSSEKRQKKKENSVNPDKVNS